MISETTIFKTSRRHNQRFQYDNAVRSSSTQFSCNILFSIHVSINFKSTSSVTCFTVHIPYHNDLFEISILINPCNHTGHKMFANKQYSHVLDIKFTSYQHCTRHRQTSIAIKLSRITTSWCRCQKIATLWPKDGFYFDIFKYQTSRSLFFSSFS